MRHRESIAESIVSDEQLVARAIDGDGEAFRRIVERYQTLICSVTYCATGDVAQSEDLAQDTFIAGWKQLAQLREPGKLRAWLCGIAHNLIRNRRRRLASEPLFQSHQLDDHAVPSPEPPPSEAAIRHEQEAIAWRALASIPERYRQPLVLYYREHYSIERVARDLGLSEAAVRQRLARGRRRLHQEVIACVEGTLARTAPDAMFTTSVMAALPLLAGSSLATIGATGGTAAPWLGAGLGAKLLTGINLVVGPLLGLLAAWLGVRASIAEAESPEERRLVKRHFLVLAAGAIAFTLISIPLNTWAKAEGGLDPAPMVVWLALLFVYLGGIIGLAVRLQRRQTRLRQQAGAAAGRATGANRGREYCSRWRLLGLPLVHVRLDFRPVEATRPAVGWIAIGNYAFGILFAWGGVAVGAVSGGGLSAGLVSIGAVSLGGLALGGLAVGAYAMGGIALGLVATGAFAFGWLGAEGRYAIAREVALGLHAAASHANDAVARQFFADRPWFDLRTTAGKALISLVWLPALFAVWRYWRRRLR